MRASRAVIGYREPFKKEILSLCEAISRHLVVERNGVRLLEAQGMTHIVYIMTHYDSLSRHWWNNRHEIAAATLNRGRFTKRTARITTRQAAPGMTHTIYYDSL